MTLSNRVTSVVIARHLCSCSHSIKEYQWPNLFCCSAQLSKEAYHPQKTKDNWNNL